MAKMGREEKRAWRSEQDQGGSKMSGLAQFLQNLPQEGILYDHLKDIARDLFQKFGILSIPVSLERDEQGRVQKKISAKWNTLVQSPTLETLEKVWFETVARRKGGKLVEDYKKILQHRGIAFVTGKISGITVVDVDDVEVFKQKIGEERFNKLLKSTLVIQSPNKGLHFYFAYTPELKTTTNVLPKVDIRNDSALIITFPSTVWSEIEPAYKLITAKDPIPMPDWLVELLKKEKATKERLTKTLGEVSERRELTPQEINLLSDLFVPVWKEGHRHNLTAYLVGFLYKKGVSCESIRRVIERIVSGANDEEAERRLNFLNYECERFEGSEFDEIKGYSGIQEELHSLVEEGVITEKGYYHILEELTNLFPHKNGDVWVRIGDHPKWGFASIKKLDCIKEWRETDKDGFHFRATLAYGHIVDLEVVREPVTDRKVWVLTWSYAGQLYRIEGSPQEVLADLEDKGFLINTKRAKEALTALLGKLERQQGVKTKWLAWGVFPSEEGGLVLNHPTLSDYQPTDEEIKKALALLHTYVNDWGERKKAEVATVVKFAISSAFHFARKYLTRSPWQWLALAGESDTGKSEDARLTKWIWDIPFENELNTSSIATEARLTSQVGRGTFALIINETTHIFSEDAKGSNIQEMLKSIWGDIYARFHLTRNRKTVATLALSPFIFTTNNPLKFSSSLAKRIKVVNYPLRAKVTKEEKREFPRVWTKETLGQLKAIGKAVFNYVAQNPRLIIENDSFEEFAEKILTTLYRKYLGFVPEWISLRPEESDVAEEATVTGHDILLYLIEYVNRTKASEGILAEIKIKSVTDTMLVIQSKIPSVPVKYDAPADEIYITRDFLDFLASKGVEAPSLKWLYEKLSEIEELEGLEYGTFTRRNIGLIGKKAVKFSAFYLRRLEEETRFALEQRKNEERGEIGATQKYETPIDKFVSDMDKDGGRIDITNWNSSIEDGGGEPDLPIDL